MKTAAALKMICRHKPKQICHEIQRDSSSFGLQVQGSLLDPRRRGATAASASMQIGRALTKQAPPDLRAADPVRDKFGLLHHCFSLIYRLFIEQRRHLTSRTVLASTFSHPQSKLSVHPSASYRSRTWLSRRRLCGSTLAAVASYGDVKHATL